MNPRPNKKTDFIGFWQCLISMSSLQIGAALSTHVIADYGVLTATSFRYVLGAAIMLIVVRPNVIRFDKRKWLSTFLLGIAMAWMTLCFFAAISRLPLGTVVAINYLGPLAVSSFTIGPGWRKLVPPLSLVGLALIIFNREGLALDPIGLAYVLGSATGWAFYIVMMKRSGNLFEGSEGLSVALAVAALATLPLGIWGSTHGLVPSDLPWFILLALLVPVIPYALEMRALRRLPSSVFAILMSLEPAIACIGGYLILSQALSVTQIVGIAAVIAVSVAVASISRQQSVAAARAQVRVFEA